PYSYQVDACDPDGDTLTYSLTTTAALQIDPDTGLITSNPNVPGTYDVGVTVTDAAGKSAYQFYRLRVAFNLPPQITSDPVTSEIAGRFYRYDVTADDPNHDLVSWSLDSTSV